MAHDPVLRLDRSSSAMATATAVGPIDLAVEQGEFLTLLGPSGCGKTTTLHIIAGLLAPDERPRASWRGATSRAVEPGAPRHGPRVPELRAVPAQDRFRQRGLRPAHAQGRHAQRSATACGACSTSSACPASRSGCRTSCRGGQRQRVALARALVIEPTVLLLDEPLSNLDAVLRKRMRHEFRDIQRRLGITTIFVTHDQDEAFEMSDRVALLNEGRVEQIGAPGGPLRRAGHALRRRVHRRGQSHRGRGWCTRMARARSASRLPSGVDLAAKVDGLGAARGRCRLSDDPPGAHRPCARAPAGRDALRGAGHPAGVFRASPLTFELEAADGVGLMCTKPSLPHFRALSPGDAVWLVPDDCRALPKAR